ncbi:efflux RND transporter periplasmic adaptor subunit [Lentzea alba]|uniref:efflux RND transporter periplasmic adaptor subunit n=1 Tax=Lentzea alba TaxID=2714351 RepID=UPI0039BF7E9E
MAEPDLDVLLGRERKRSRRGLVVAVVVVVVIGGAATGAWYACASRSEPASAAPPLATARVERQTLRDTFTVRGVARYRDTATVRAVGSGVVTELGLTTGQVVQPGAVVYRVAGTPVVAMTGAFPFWRDVGRGATGIDVKQLESFLKAAGQNPGPVDETFTAATERAVKNWQKAVGVKQTGAIKADEVITAPWPARVGKVDVKVGDQVSPGGQVAALTEPNAAVSIDLDPGQRLRALKGQKVEIQVTSSRAKATGTVAEIDATPTTSNSQNNQSGGDGSSSNQGSSSPVYKATVALDAPLDVVDGTQLSALVVLSEEADVLTVPVGAVIQDGQGKPVVRVAEAGGSRQVPVELGTQSGAYVAVRKGLTGDETVVLGGAG